MGWCFRLQAAPQRRGATGGVLLCGPGPVATRPAESCPRSPGANSWEPEGREAGPQARRPCVWWTQGRAARGLVPVLSLPHEHLGLEPVDASAWLGSQQAPLTSCAREPRGQNEAEAAFSHKETNTALPEPLGVWGSGLCPGKKRRSPDEAGEGLQLGLFITLFSLLRGLPSTGF